MHYGCITEPFVQLIGKLIDGSFNDPHRWIIREHLTAPAGRPRHWVLGATWCNAVDAIWGTVLVSLVAYYRLFRRDLHTGRYNPSLSCLYIVMFTSNDASINESFSIFDCRQGQIPPKDKSHHDANPVAKRVFRRESNIL
jgi:hypothetical protein